MSLKCSVWWILPLAVALPAQAQSVCDSKAGTTVEFDDIAQTFSVLETLDYAKDEFETENQYRTRIKSQALGLSLPPELVLKTDFIASAAKYDPENQKIVIESHQLDDNKGSALTAVEYSNLELPALANGYDWAPDAILSYDHYEVGLDLHRDASEATAMAVHNVYGAETTVIYQDSDHFFLFDSPQIEEVSFEEIYPGSSSLIERRVSLPMWAYNDFVVEYEGTTIERKKEVLTIPLSPEEARLVKDSLQFAVVGKPKFPFVQTKSEFSEATFLKRMGGQLNFHIMIADIECGLFTDSEGKVLKVVETGYGDLVNEP